MPAFANRPANIDEFLTFCPDQPRLHPEANNSSAIEPYSARDITPPADASISCRPDPTLLPRLKDFIRGAVDSCGVGGASCQPMQAALNHMRRIAFESTDDVSEYGDYAIAAIEPIVEAIAEAAGIADTISVRRRAVPKSTESDFSLLVQREIETEAGHTKWVPIQICSDNDIAYSVLLSKAEELSQSFSLDTNQKQRSAKAMVVKLVLQMIAANTEYGLFFAGFIAIAAQLVHSTDPSRPGRILLLSPIFKLHNKTLPDPSPKEHLTPFQANIQTEPFFAIIVAMLCANILPGHAVESPPAHLCQLLPLDEMLDAENDDGDVDSFEEDSDGDEAEPSGIPECSLQVITNAMVLHHPWLNCMDIHRISVIGHPPPPLSDVQNIPAKNSGSLTKSLSPSPMQPQNLLRAPRIISTHVDMVTLVDQLRASRWSSIYTCRVEDDDKLHIMKLVSELHSVMVLRELYMYEVALKDSSLVPKFYGMFQRPAAGWFGFLLENVGDSLDEVYGPDWSDVKSSVSTTEWQRLIDSVIELHSLGVLHDDLEPRNVALTAEGFKFFDFGQSKMHHCQRDECYELRNLLYV